MEKTDLNIGSLCRLCGFKTQSRDRVEIFSSVDLSLLIRSLLALDLSESDLLPTFVCSECAAKLANFNEFKASSHRTNLMFTEFLDNARGASRVDCPGLSNDVATDNVLSDSVTFDEFKFEDEPEIDVSNYIREPVISDDIEQFLESDPLSFELDSITECTLEVLPDNSNTNTQDKSLEISSQPYLYDSQTRVQNESFYPKIQSNYSSHTVPSQHSILKDLLFASHTKVQPIKSFDINKGLSSTNNSAAKPSKFYMGVQVQSSHTTPAVELKDAYSTVQVLLPSSRVPNSNSVHGNLTASVKNKTPKTYKCKVCNKILKTATNFKMHMKYHNKDYSYICQYCNKGFFSNSKMQIHIRESHTKEMPFDCNKCGQKFVQQFKLRLHMEAFHLKSMKYYCKICKKSFKLVKTLRVHARRKHLGVAVPIAFSCDVCGEVFDDKANLVKHISLNHQKIKKPPSEETAYSNSLVQYNEKFSPPTSIRDNTSEEAFVDSISLVESTNNQSSKQEMVIDQKSRECSKNSELSSKQPNRQLENSDSKLKRAVVKIISCPHCYIVFRNIIELNFHINIAHKINCTYCTKSFSCDQDLQDHIKAEHTKVNAFEFVVMPGQLQEQNAKELSEKKDFQCKLCSKNLKNLRNLKLHNSRLHNKNRKKYTCEICKNKVFFYKRNLVHHINVKHLGNLYSCKFCNKTFNCLLGITAHRESKHFNIKETCIMQDMQ